MTVTATDTSDATDTIAVTINVTNVDEAGSVALAPAQPVVGTALTATLADPDGSISATWVWAGSTDGLTGWTDISGATSGSYTPVAADVDSYLRATATYTDGEGTGKSAQAVSANIVRDVDDQVVSAPARPSGLAATAGLERVTLSWEDPGDSSITGYEYYQAAELAKLTASDGAGNDNFGWSVSVGGDTMVVGAYSDDDNGADSGSAYVFVRPAGEDWSEATQVAKLTASDGAGGDEFGRAVSVDGDTIAVGAYGDDNSTGSAYVFVKPSTGWATATETAKLTASDGAADDEFGWSVSVDGDTMVVGARMDDGSGSNSGSAYVFVKPSTGWTTTTEMAKMTASDGAAGDRFGTSVSVGGDTVVVVAYRDDDNGADSGSAYVFVRPSDGEWTTATETAKLTASDGAADDEFGWSVSVDGDTMVVGAPLDDGSGSNSGSAYVFVKPSTGWATTTETAKLTASDGAEGDRFGTSVSVDGDTIAVGAYGDDNFTGSAYLFVKPATGWAATTETLKLAASDGAGGDYFGFSVSVDGNTVVAGAFLDDDNGSVSGSAYAFAVSGWMRISGSGTGTIEHTVEGLDGWVEHTFSIRAVNGGGLSPASRSVTATPFTNRAPEFTTATAALEVAENAAAGENIGEPVTAADPDTGDTLVYSLSGVDAASFAIDTATGQLRTRSALDYETRNSYTVTVEVTDGSLTDTISVTINVTNLEEAGSVALAPGQPVVGTALTATLTDPDGSISAATWVWAGSTDGSTRWTDISGATLASYTPTADDVGSYLRATAAYTDGAGAGKSAQAVSANIVRDVDDQVVLAPARPSGLSATAVLERVTLSWEDPGDSSITGYEYYQAAELAKLTASDGAGGDQFGFSVSVDGDTMVVGADRDDDNGADSGSAYVFVRPAGGDWSEARQVAKLTASDRFLSDQFGHSVSVEGGTVVLGSKGDDDNGSGSGSAYVFVRPSAGWASATETAKLTASDGVGGDVFGTSVSVDGDTVVVGASAAVGGSSSGSAYAFAASGWMRIGGSGTGTIEHTVEELDGWIEHTFGIRALNGGGLGPVSRSVTATPFANRAPEFATTTTARSVAENTAAGENIGGPVAAADLDSGDTLVYSLSGVDAASFAIDTATGQITVGSGTSLDYETKASYSVTVSVHDGKDSGENADTTVDDTIDVTINVTDVDLPLTPGAPTVAPAATNGHTRLEVAWAAPGITGWPYLTGYNVRYRKSGASSDWTLRTSRGAVPALTTGITISGLESSTGYEVQISAINDEGESSWSDSGTSTTDAAILDLTVQFSAATYEATEGGAATTITVLISPPANREVVVGIKSNPRAGTTFDSGEFAVVGLTRGVSLTINRGNATRSFTIQAQHDDDGVHDQIDLGFFDPPTQVTAGERSSAVLTVTDDEGGTVTLSAAQPEVSVAISATLADPPGPVTGVTWVWSRSEDGLANWSDIADATSASYTPVAVDRGDYLRATATYTDDQGPGQKAWKVTANIVRDVDEQPALSGSSAVIYAENGTALVASYTASGIYLPFI